MNVNDTLVMSTVEMVVVGFVLLVICCTASGLIARKEDDKLNERSPDSLTYQWGYFLGYYGIIFAAMCIGTGVVLMVRGFYHEWFPILLGYLVVYAIASYGVIARRRWGWMLQIPLTLNPGLWALNSVYFSNRWRELS